MEKQRIRNVIEQSVVLWKTLDSIYINVLFLIDYKKNFIDYCASVLFKKKWKKLMRKSASRVLLTFPYTKNIQITQIYIDLYLLTSACVTQMELHLFSIIIFLTYIFTPTISTKSVFMFESIKKRTDKNMHQIKIFSLTLWTNKFVRCVQE